jgi:hypothetical protein
MPVWFLLVMVSLAFTTTDIFELCASCYQVRMECFFTTKFAIYSYPDGSSLCSYKTCQEERDLKLKSGVLHLCIHGKLAAEEQSHSAPEHEIQRDDFRFVPYS